MNATKPEETVRSLRLEAHAYIDRICHRPGAAKLLMGLLPVLKLYADYKNNRKRPRRTEKDSVI